MKTKAKGNETGKEYMRKVMALPVRKGGFINLGDSKLLNDFPMTIALREFIEALVANADKAASAEKRDAARDIAYDQAKGAIAFAQAARLVGKDDAEALTRVLEVL